MINVGDTVKLRSRQFSPKRFLPIQSYSDCGNVIIDSKSEGIVVEIHSHRTCDYVNTKTGENKKYPLISVMYDSYILSLYEPSFEKLKS